MVFTYLKHFEYKTKVLDKFEEATVLVPISSQDCTMLVSLAGYYVRIAMEGGRRCYRILGTNF